MLNIINYNEITALHVPVWQRYNILWQRYNIIELVLPGVEYLVHVQVWYWFHLVAPVKIEKVASSQPFASSCHPFGLADVPLFG